MILACDIGNGSFKWGLYDGDRRTDGGKWELDADWSGLPPADDVRAVSVNDAATRRLRALRPATRVLGEEIPLPLPLSYAECGPDRVAGAWGALHLRPTAPGVLLLDAGTCLTATVAARDGGVLGGAILPGFALMARALASGTARLPEIAFAPPGPHLGRSTDDAIRSGLWAALAGAAVALIDGLRAETAVALDVVAAGTGAGLLATRVAGIDAVHEDATLIGLCKTGADPDTADS